MGLPLPPLVALGVLAAAHVLTPDLRFLRGIPRSVWLSMFGGIAVSYVFVHLLPELAAAQEHVGRAAAARGLHAGVAGLRFGERHVYLIALAGLSLFYGIDRLAKRSRGARAGHVVAAGVMAGRRPRPPAPLSSGSTWPPSACTTHSWATCCCTASSRAPRASRSTPSR